MKRDGRGAGRPFRPGRGAVLVLLGCVLAWAVAPGAFAHRKGGYGPRPPAKPPAPGIKVPIPNVGPGLGKNPTSGRIGKKPPPGTPIVDVSGLDPSEATLRGAMGLPVSGPLSPEDQARVEEILSVWEALARGELPEYEGSDDGPSLVQSLPSLRATPQEEIDRQNLIEAYRQRQREEQEWRVWIITKTGGLLVGAAGLGLPGAVIYNEIVSDSGSDANTAAERAEGKVKGDLAGGALGTGAGYVAGRVADRFVPGSGPMVQGAVSESVGQVAGDQIENALKDKYRRQRESANAFARQHEDEVLREMFGGPVTPPPTTNPEPNPFGVKPKPPRPPPPVMRDAGGGTSNQRSVPVMRATRDSVPTLSASSSDTQAGRRADAMQANWWLR